MLFSLGHSTYQQDDFIDICKTADIDTIIDTRSHPGSANFPHYNKSRMSEWLPQAGIDYQWWPSLGGWDTRHVLLAPEFKKFDVDIAIYCNNAFPKQRIAKKHKIEVEDSGFTNYGFHDYQFFMTLPEFIDGVQRLVEQSKTTRSACICCEACWTRCHRSMIADYLVWQGFDMTHITPRFRKIKKPRVAVTLKNHSEVIKNRLLRYDQFVIEKWQTSLASTDTV